MEINHSHKTYRIAFFHLLSIYYLKIKTQGDTSITSEALKGILHIYIVWFYPYFNKGIILYKMQRLKLAYIAGMWKNMFKTYMIHDTIWVLHANHTLHNACCMLHAKWNNFIRVILGQTDNGEKLMKWKKNTVFIKFIKIRNKT